VSVVVVVVVVYFIIDSVWKLLDIPLYIMQRKSMFMININ